MYVYSAPVPQWPVDQYTLQPDVIGACVCDGGGEYWIVNGNFTPLLDASFLKVLLCNKVLVFLPLSHFFPLAQLSWPPFPLPIHYLATFGLLDSSSV